MTTAQQIAARYDNDGQVWEDSDGVELQDALETAGARSWQRGQMPQRWQLSDGSAIIITDGAWDLGITDTGEPDRRECTCWSDHGVTCRYPCECSCHTEAITDQQIKALRIAAAIAGDLDQILICDRALSGDEGARDECARVIADAEAQP